MENPDSIWQKTGEVGMVITEVNMENWEQNCIKQEDRREEPKIKMLGQRDK